MLSFTVIPGVILIHGRSGYSAKLPLGNVREETGIESRELSVKAQQNRLQSCAK